MTLVLYDSNWMKDEWEGEPYCIILKFLQMFGLIGSLLYIHLLCSVCLQDVVSSCESYGQMNGFEVDPLLLINSKGTWILS